MHYIINKKWKITALIILEVLHIDELISAISKLRYPKLQPSKNLLCAFVILYCIYNVIPVKYKDISKIRLKYC